MTQIYAHGSYDLNYRVKISQTNTELYKIRTSIQTSFFTYKLYFFSNFLLLPPERATF